MKINYIRISSGSQNNDIQVFNLPSDNKVFKDTISGSIAFSDRPEGAKIIELVKEGRIDTIYINDISRIGRDNIDVLNMIQFFTENGVNLISRREGLSTMIEGKVNPIASLIIGILSTLAQHELERLKERQREGIARAKDRGVYSSHGGNRKEETRVEFLAKSDTKKIIKYLNEGNSLRRSALLSKASLGKVQKVARMLQDIENDKVKFNNKIVTQVLSDRAKAVEDKEDKKGFKGSFEQWLDLPKNKKYKDIQAEIDKEKEGKS